ncbi:MAG: hypothetical protein ACXWZW_07955 [Solirubrobacterales bacterium]
MREQSEKFGDRLVSLNQLVFAIALVQPILIYRDVVLEPLDDGHYVALAALAAVYLTALWSWIGWHRLMVARPYAAIDERGGSVRSEYGRFYVDLAIVTTYAYMLLQVDPLADDSEGSLFWLGLGWPVVFGLYALSTRLRQARHPDATTPRPILVCLAASAALLAAYCAVRWIADPDGWGAEALSIATLIGMVAIMRGYWRASAERWRAQVRGPLP